MSDREKQFSWFVTMQTIFFFPAGSAVQYLGELDGICLLSFDYAFWHVHYLKWLSNRGKKIRGFTGTGCCQKGRLYWNRCFENLWKPAERCQNVHNTNQQFTGILCEFDVVSGKFRRSPQQRLSALGTASQFNRQTLVCSITACMMLSCRREDKGKKKNISFCYIYILHYLGINKSGKKDITTSS